MLERIEDHLGTALESLFPVLKLEHVFPIVDILAPDRLGPESSLVDEILVDVTDNVGLLEELTHALRQLHTLEERWVGEITLNEQAGETLAHQAGNVMAVKLVFLDSVDAVGVVLSVQGVVGHTVAHLDGDLADDVVVRLLDLLQL